MAKKKTRSKQSIAKDETKQERFTRVVTPRVNKALKAIKVIGYCSGSTYDYSENQAKQIINALGEGVAELQSRFSREVSKTTGFDFET